MILDRVCAFSASRLATIDLEENYLAVYILRINARGETMPNIFVP